MKHFLRPVSLAGSHRGRASGAVAPAPKLTRSQPFSCTWTDGRAGAAWVRPVGALDGATSPSLRTALAAAQAVASHVVLDLRGVEFLDDSGLDVILDADRTAGFSDGRLIVVRGPAHVQRMFAEGAPAEVLEFVHLDPAQPPVQALLLTVARRGSPVIRDRTTR